MNKRVLQALKERKHRLNEILFRYDSIMGTEEGMIVTCYLERHTDDHMGKYNNSVLAIGRSEDEALDRALKLLEELSHLEEQINVPKGDPTRQKWNKGYDRKMVMANVEVEWRRENDIFYVSRISTKDEGFYVVKEPFPVPSKNWKQIDGNVWEWDDIGFLCGSRGVAIVEDGLVKKTKMTARA